MSYTPNNNPARQFGGFAFVILLHIGIIYALVSGLGRQVVEVIRAPLETHIIDEVKQQKDLPPPPPPKFAPPPPPYIPPPEISIRQAVAPTNAIQQVTTTKPVEAPPPPAPVVQAPPAPAVHTPPVVDAAKGCKQPEYPPVSKRLEESGVVVLQFLIGTDGSVLDSKVDSTSGYPRLDDAARSALSLCHFKPGAVDGKPEQSWAKIRYTWKID